jgi:hypothetical protein
MMSARAQRCSLQRRIGSNSRARSSVAFVDPAWSMTGAFTSSTATAFTAAADRIASPPKLW